MASLHVSGVLRITPYQYGFLHPEPSEHSSDDIFVSQSIIRRFGLKHGDQIVGQARMPSGLEEHRYLVLIETINGQPVEGARD
jgi:transcription termination factor Rho